ncbi:hypothetical protein Flavo103_44780 [Flavobacterium collinsii]|uniref:hypothetical protein n=1 Tax=Flavobacterium collinsii TaxID=1114861 RepID=UPI0022BE76CB|nr:hypothetical protein [Flavobacterium collinsii]GIQ61343.1 hypothetical protein Flavo103_44780 [Flavobacterium collinsii]
MANEKNPTLKTLYQEIQTNIEKGNGTCTLVPDVLDTTDTIGKFYSDITLSGTLTVNNATLSPSTWDDKLTAFKLLGDTTSFGVGDMGISIIFATDDIGLYSKLDATLSNGTWAINGIDWFSISSPFIGVQVYDNNMPVIGAMGGTIAVSSAVNVALQMVYPIANNIWLFQGNFNEPYPSISNFYQLVGGVNLTSALPQPFSTLSTLGLKTIDISYNSSKTRVDYIAVNISTPPDYNWQILPGLAVSGIDIKCLVLGFGATGGITTQFTITGNFTIGPPKSNNVMLTAQVPNFKASVQLIDGTIQLGDLLTMFWTGTTIDLQSEITVLEVQIDPSAKNYILNCTVVTDWVFFTITSPNLSFTMKGLALNISSQQGVTTGEISGQFHIGPDTPDSGVDLTTFAKYDGDAWIFGASTGTDQVISLGDIAVTFLQAFGMGYDTIPSWVKDNLPSISNVSFTDILPNDKAKSSTYNVKGDVAWHLQYSSFNLDLSANVDITYTDGKTSGTITGTADAKQMLGLTFIVGYKFGTPDTEVYLKIPEFASTITYTSNIKYDIIDIKFDKISLGEIVSTLVGTFSPGFSLSAPWNILNSIDLSNFEFTYTRYKDSAQSSIVATIPIKVDLGFINIKSLKITKDDSIAGSGVYIFIDGTFLGLPIESDSPLQKDGKGSDATKMPAVPGMGSEFFDLKLLAMGQHVTMYDVPSLDSVDAAITALSTAFTATSDESSTAIPVPAATSTTKPGTLVFDQNSNWLIGTDFTVAKFYRIAAVFNDPNMYGLLVGVSKDAGAFKNLQFEILYKKINDSIGMYQIDLQLPDQFRHLEFGAVSITLPIIGVKVYTNGNFYLDFGFPASITDFSRSFSVQVFPFVGFGGFYFGYLSGATSSSVPTTTCGVFNPVIEFGLGLSLGVGKTVDQGILKAGLSLTAVGIFQGVLGFFTANTSLSTHDETYFKIQGTFGLTGHIYGEINFAIISARLDIMAYAYITMIIESYKPIPITFEAGVSVKLTVKINLGFFSIKVSLHFSATISASFIIGSDTSATAPWNYCPIKGSGQRVALDMTSRTLNTMSLNAAPVYLKWQPIQPATKVPLDLLFFPQLTVSGETGSAGPQYASMLYINTDPNDNSLAALTEGVLYWALNALIGNTSENTGLNWLKEQTITADQISTLLCYFNTRPNHVAPFNYINATNNDIRTFFSTYFQLNIRAVDATQEGSMDAAVFPVVPELILNTDLNGTVGTPVNFATQNMTGTQNYISDITVLLASSAVDYQSNITAEYYDSSDCSNVSDPTYEEQHNLSFPTFMFTDFVALLAKQALQAAADYLDKQGTPSAKVSDVVSNAVTDSVQGIGGMASRFMLHGLRLPQPPDASKGVTQPLYVLTGQQIAIPSALKAGDKYSVLLQNPNASWITMVSGTNNTLTITIDDSEIQHINDVAAITLSPTLSYGPTALINYNDTPQTFSLGAPALWQYPGDYYPGITNQPVIWKLPSNLTTIFAEEGNWLFDVKTLTTTDTGTTKAIVKNYTWGTVVNFALQKITAVDGQITPLSNNMYNLVGADDAGTVFLQELLTYLNTHGDSDGTKTIQQIQILYQPDPTENGNGGYISDLNGGYKTAIVQANLSTETNPAEAMFARSFIAEIPERDYNTLNNAGDFIKLLWECSIVRSGGFYFYYNNSENKGLPDTLFAGNGIANIALVVTYDNLILSPFVNSVVIGDTIDTTNTSVYVQSPDTAPIAQQYTTRVATLLPGTVGYEVSRKNPGDYVPTQPVPTLAEDQIYLQTQFNLIGLTVPAIPAYINPTPAGPVDSMDDEAIQNTKNGNASANDDVEDWNYSAVVPYYKYVQPQGTDPKYPNPYAGIGTTVQMVMNWQDMFGNVPPKGTTPLNASMQLLYADAIIALSQWPSVSVSYLFSPVSGKPNIGLNFNFNTVRYIGEGAQNNAQIDIITFMNIYYQLSNSDMVIHYTTTVEDQANTQGVITPTDHSIANSDLLNHFINPIIVYLNAIIAGQAPVAVQTYTINSAVSTTNIITLPEISLVSTSLTMKRVANLDPNFVNVAGVALSSTVIQPLSENGVNAMLALTYFAEQFEAAFINQPNTGIVLKAATGANLTKGNSDTTANAPLWMVRFDSTGVNGLKFGFNNQQVYYFAPIPLATSLQSFSAKINTYQQGKPYPTDNGITKNYTSIDMDSWGLQFLQAVDKFLSPSYSVPAFLLTANDVFAGDPDYLQLILDAKQKLAEAIEGTIDFIIEPSAGKEPSNIGNAQEKWKQQILIQLANAYRYIASVQTTASISSAYKGAEYANSNNVPPQQPYVPSLYGKMLGLDPTAAGSDTILKSTEYSLSTAKVPTANGNSWLTYMFEAKDAAESRSFSFSEMEYNVSHLEFDITQIPDLADYLASSWLTFIVPLDGQIDHKDSPLANMSDVGETAIPVPLRAYPTPPSISAQNFDYPVNEFTQLQPITIAEARQWEYYYTYQNPSAAQDTIVTEIQFNVTDQNQSFYASANTPNLGLYQAFAQFIDSYPLINADFDNCLALLTPATLKADSTLAINARYAMLAFIDIVNQVADQWSVTNQVNPRKTTLGARAFSTAPAPPFTLSYTITESPQEETEYLIVTIDSTNQQSANVTIDVSITGYTSEPIEGKTNEYLYYTTDNEGNKIHLLYEDRNNDPSRTVQLNDLDILTAQNAWSSVAVIRNEELLQNEDGTWQTTNKSFIYQTPQVMFYNKLIPLLNANNAIDINTIATPTYPVQPTRTLNVQLLALFDALTENIDPAITGFTIKMQCDYSYVIPGTTFPVDIPVLLVTPTELTVADHGKSMADLISGGINSWIESNSPQTNAGAYTFMLTAYSVTDSYVPILQIPLTLLLVDIIT